MMPRGAAAGRILKAAFADLLHSLGYLKVAAGECRVGVSTLHRYASLNTEDADKHAPIDVVAQLERVAGEPLVTRKLCELAGGVFVPLPTAPATREDLLFLLSRKARESSELTAAAIECCTAVDDAPEKRRAAARRAIKELDDVVAVAMTMRAALETLEGDE
ncbi:hypothetical protein [Sphingomonas sp.]|uniref:hypothetical protein n=1 Tax=Sphingomonas sp. TaxID=28214 RepID=UPI0035B332AC